MGKIIRNGVEYSGAVEAATAVNYDGSVSGLNAQTVQEAVDELAQHFTSSMRIETETLTSNQYGWATSQYESDYYITPLCWDTFSDGNGLVIKSNSDINNENHATFKFAIHSDNTVKNANNTTVTVTMLLIPKN